MTRTVGILLIIAAVAVCLLGSAFLVVGALTGQSTSLAALVLGFALLLIVLVAPLAGGGILVLVRSRREESETEEAGELRRILDMVETRGKVDISDVIIELQSDLPTVQGMIYRLVGMGVFSGYVNWDEGTLYSIEASQIRELQQCKHCGGTVSFAGKGVLKCPFCGTEYFLATE
jgi:ribosomal protein S27AE/membrane protein implicated in regulation of membrane protease activity